MLYAFIFRLVPSMADADDILQETNLVLWSKQAEFTPGTDFRAWAFRIARFQVMAHRRRQSLDRLIFGDELVERLARQAESGCGRWTTSANCCSMPAEAQRFAAATARQPLRQSAFRPGDRGEEPRKANAVFQSLHRTRETLLRCIEQGLTKRGDD